MKNFKICHIFRIRKQIVVFFGFATVLVDVEIDQGHLLYQSEVARNEKQTKNYLGFLVPKIRQILKCFAGIFHRGKIMKL